jgi:hypothetical protein
MVRFATHIPLTALAALLAGCGSGSHQPVPPAAAPAPAVQPEVTPPTAVPKAPKTEPQDSADTGKYPWPSGPIASR